MPDPMALVLVLLEAQRVPVLVVPIMEVLEFLFSFPLEVPFSYSFPNQLQSTQPLARIDEPFSASLGIEQGRLVLFFLHIYP